MEEQIAASEICQKKDPNKNLRDLSSMSREALETRILQLEAHNIQLKNILAKSSSDAQNVPSKSKRNRAFDFSKHQKRHILLKFAYLGWEKQGFTVQEDTPDTVEAALFDALLKTKLIESRQTANYHRCGRTDKGVSAFSQVVSITVRSSLRESNGNQEEAQNGNTKLHPAKNLLIDDAEENANNLKNELNYPQILNRVLPPDIRILSWSPVKQDFSARFDCFKRVYKYFFPLANLNLEAMRTAAQFMVGEHDFRNLCKMDVGNGVVKFVRNITDISLSEVDSDNLNVQINSKKNSTCKKVFENDNREEIEIEDNAIKWKKGYKMCVATFEGNAFLWHQIRAMMSILILVGEGKEDPEIVKNLLDINAVTGRPQYGLAREDGLILYDTKYDNINWQYDQQNITLVLTELKNIWIGHSIKSSLLQAMIGDLSDTLTKINGLKGHNLPWTRDKSYINEPRSKSYVKLLDRKRCKSLAECIQTHVKRGRLEPSVLDEIILNEEALVTEEL